jgi:ABC-type spermidine/putrescine transport system permease subunit I
MILLQKTGLLNQALGRLGLVREPLDLMYNETGVLIAMVNMLLPYVIFPVLSSLLAIPPELRQASASLGAGGLRTFWRVTLPLSLPGVAAGGLLVFIVALGFFITPALLGGPKQMMISNLIEFSVRQVLNWPFAFALANTLLTGTLLLYFAYVRVLGGRMPRTGFP